MMVATGGGSRLQALHRWLGLPLALILMIQALTGMAVMFRHEGNLVLHGDSMQVTHGPSLAIDRIIAGILADRPGSFVSRIDYPPAPGQTYMIRLDGTDGHRRLSVDPATGRVLREGPLWHWPVEGLFDTHHTLLLGRNGQTLAGISGIGLLILSLTGPFLWWRGRGRQVRRWLAVSLGGGRARMLRDLHRLAGILLLLPLLCLSGTGIVLAMKISVTPLVALLAPVQAKPSPQVAAQADRPLMALQRVVDRAQAAYGGAPVRNVRFPGGHGRVVLVYLDDPTHERPAASNQLWLDGYDGRILGRYAAADLPAGSRFIEWMLPIHSGIVGGLPLRLYWLLGGAGLVLLLVSGTWSWMVRRRAMPRTLVVAAVTLLSDRVVALRLAHPWGLPLPMAPAGAHLDLYLPGGLVRQYSLTNSPDQRDGYHIAVQRADPSRGGSVAVQGLRAGDPVRVGQPRQAFALSSDAPHHLLLAAGIGITPIIAMADRLWRCGADFSLHYAVRHEDQVLFADRLARFGDRVQLYPSPDRRLSVPDLLAAAPPDTHVYACGPARLLDQVQAVAAQRGWNGARVHMERFLAHGPGADAAAFTLRLVASGRVVPVAANQTMAQALIDAGVPVTLSCGQGLCGACVLPLVSGTALHRDHCLTPAERESRITPCCSRGEGELVLD